MISKSFFQAGCALFFLTISAAASTVPLDTLSYNFALAGGGGGASATLNSLPVEIFCVDFANEIWVPWNYSVNVTQLGTSPNLSETRFGGVASTGWTPIVLTDGSSVDNQDELFFNNPNGSTPEAGSTALARYDMAAFLVSLYNRSQGGSTSNNQIQEAIWTLMDPSATGQPLIDPSGVNPDGYLEEAAAWYMNNSGNQNYMSSFLSQFEIIIDPSMTFSNGLGVGGFQEQLVMVTPEPRGVAWVLLGLLLGGFWMARRNQVVCKMANA